MAYFKDLDDYSYFDEAGQVASKCVGWLEKGMAYDIGEISEEVLDRVWEYCQVSLMQSRGTHICELCDDGQGWTGNRNGVKLQLGSAEIRVFGEGGTIYAAPDLIYHYMRDHHYRPPEAFLEALMRSPRPASPDYIQQIERHKFDWFLREHNRKKIWAEPSVKKAIHGLESRVTLWRETEHAMIRLNQNFLNNPMKYKVLSSKMELMGYNKGDGLLAEILEKDNQQYQVTAISFDGEVTCFHIDLQDPKRCWTDNLTQLFVQAFEAEGGPKQDILKAATYAHALRMKTLWI